MLYYCYIIAYYIIWCVAFPSKKSHLIKTLAVLKLMEKSRLTQKHKLNLVLKETFWNEQTVFTVLVWQVECRRAIYIFSK